MPTVTRRAPVPTIVLASTFVALTGLPLLSGHARAADPVADGTIDFTQTTPAADRASDELLIRYRADVPEAERLATEQDAGLDRVEGTDTSGGTVAVEAGGRSPATVRRALQADPNVVAVAPNHQRSLAVDINLEPYFSYEWGLHNTGQTIDGLIEQTGIADVDIDALEALRHGAGSSSTVIAVVDDGIDFAHPDLAARAWTNPGEAGALSDNGVDDDGNGYIDDVHGWDFCNDDNTVHDAGEDGHGTHVAGIIAASADKAGIVGVAPNVRLMALKFIDDSTSCGFDSQAIAAIDYAASFGVRIMNASWGGPGASPVLDAAIADSNSLFVTAAGNQGANQDGPGADPSYPGASTLPNILNVAAIDQRGALADFSNYGTTSVDIAAPGTNILSTYVAIGPCSTACYAFADGTSMAAPYVTGVAALTGGAAPYLLADPVKLRSRILARGVTVAGAVGKTATGRLVNADRAVDFTKPIAYAPTRYSFTTGGTLGTSVPVTVGWPAGKDTGSGIASYTLKRSTESGSPAVATGVTTTSAPTAILPVTETRFVTLATDNARNESAPATGSPLWLRVFQDQNATFDAKWATVTSGSASGGQLHRTSTAGATMTFSFTGRAVAIVSPKSAAHGSFRVYLDGVLHTTVSLYQATSKAKVLVYGASWSGNGPHTVKVVAVGTAGHPRVDIDAIAVLETLP